ncbi:MAG: phosphatidylserine decarboxylase [Bacillota bacterium]
MKINYLDRETGCVHEEKVAGEKYLKWLYSNPLGMGLLELVFKKKMFSHIYGRLQDMSWSKGKVSTFVKDYDIQLDECKKELHQFSSFNDFFYRELKEGARKIEMDKDVVISPADGRLLVYDKIAIDNLLQIKGSTYSMIDLIGNKQLAETYEQGVCYIIRLCPVDYHRFHFPDSGMPGKAKEVKGHYYSVNPIALHKKAQIYCQNKRDITIFDSDNFAKILLMEVGATCVGSIVHTFNPRQWVKKGSEKGYFKFGGSTVIMFFQPGIIEPDQDLLINTEKGIETKVKMGMSIGKKRTMI